MLEVICLDLCKSSKALSFLHSCHKSSQNGLEVATATFLNDGVSYLSLCVLNGAQLWLCAAMIASKKNNTAMIHFLYHEGSVGWSFTFLYDIA